jgi:DNA invertase Pin-like site-specific DNA recombinase
MIYFYARVSSKDQNLDRQLEAAKSFKNIDKVFCDKQSGKNFDRPEYIALKEVVAEGDEVIVKELDRLGRDKD